MRFGESWTSRGEFLQPMLAAAEKPGERPGEFES
jgi:hypothetical protein